MAIQNPAELSAFITAKNEDISVTTIGVVVSIHTSTTSQPSFSLKLVAEISSPVINSVTLQAVSVAIKGDIAFIAYNTRGAQYTGALDIVDISTPTQPKLLSRTTFTNKDINSVSYSENTIILAEAFESGIEGKNSQIEWVPLKKNIPDFTKSASALLPSYAGTSVYAHSSKQFVTSGSMGGLYMFDSSSLQLDQELISDARWVTGSGNDVLVLSGGNNPALYYYQISRNTLSPIAHFSIAGASELEAKSVVELVSNYAVVGGNKQGVLIYNLDTAQLVARISIPVLNNANIQISSNSVSVDKDLIIISNGEAGVYIAQNPQNLSAVHKDSDMKPVILGQLDFGTSISVNHVEYKNDVLIVAAGLGGVKIVSVTNNK